MTGDANVDRALSVLSLIKTQYPQYWALLTLEPQILQIFTDVYNDPTAWPPERIQAAIANTPWFRNTPAPQRNWAVLAAVDPATARQTALQYDQLVKQVAGQMGIPPNQIDALMVLTAAAEQWSESRIRYELAARLDPSVSALGPGIISAYHDQYQAMAAQQGLNLDNNALQWWAMNTAGGSVTQEGFQSYLLQQAKNMYPALTYALDAGQTVSQFAAPYFSLAAQELGIAPTLIMANNPHWMDLVVSQTDRGQGVLSMNEALAKIRSDPSYGYDAGLPGRTQAAQFAGQLMKEFGAMG